MISSAFSLSCTRSRAIDLVRAGHSHTHKRTAHTHKDTNTPRRDKSKWCANFNSKPASNALRLSFLCGPPKHGGDPWTFLWSRAPENRQRRYQAPGMYPALCRPSPFSYTTSTAQRSVTFSGVPASQPAASCKSVGSKREREHAV